MNKFKPGDYVKCNRFKGVAMYVHSYAFRHEYNDEDDSCEHIPYDDKYSCVMVGDDYAYDIDEEDLEFLSTSEFCVECGQIGCTHNVLEES
jgi:hypothetical protein